MKLPNEFEEYLKNKIIKRIIPNNSRANFLIDESKNSLQGLKERVEKIGINPKNSNSIIKDCYDIIIEIIRAKLLIDGYVSSGLYAHEAEGFKRLNKTNVYNLGVANYKIIDI